MSTPEKNKRRRSDKSRDIWLFVISAILLYSAIVAQNSSNKATRTASQAKMLAIQNHDLTLQTRSLTIQIQRQRIDNLKRDCENTNSRNAATIKQLNKEFVFFKKHLPPGTTQAQLKANIKQSIALIDALSPHQDCNKLIRAAQTTS